MELHFFVDAGELPWLLYAFFDGSGETRFGIGRKCCPLKYTPITRRHVQTSLYGLRMNKSVIEFHRFKIDQGSRTVLYWISNMYVKKLTAGK